MSAATSSEVVAGNANRHEAAAQQAVSTDDVIEFISFSIGEDQYGVDIMSVREIKGWSSVTHLPRQPDYVRGVLNLRGAMVPIIDLRCRFGEGTTEATPMHVVIIVALGGERLVGLLADRVLDIVPFESSRIQKVPQVEGHGQTDFLSGLISVEDKMIALINLEHLVPAEASH